MRWKASPCSSGACWAIRSIAANGGAKCGNTVFLAAVIIDVVYQDIVEHWISRSEALMVGLTVFSYLFVRGIVNRVLRSRARGKMTQSAGNNRLTTVKH